MLPRPASSIRFPRLLLTGAAGNLGRELRPRLKAYCDTLRVSHRSDAIDPAGPGEELAVADLADKAAVAAMLDGVDAVVHLGGVSTEQTWESILDGNIVGMVHLYEAARHAGTKRIVFASSNHVTGFYRQDEIVSPRDPVRPDGFYGLSKCFGENLAQLYWDRFGIETVSVRIGSSFAAPKDRRMLATWMSFDDTERLIVAALTAPVVGHSIVYGMSDNATTWWDNTSARHIGYRPQDSSDVFRAEVEARQQTLDRDDPAVHYQGGAFVRTGPFFTQE
ncbi:NAD-dependent epimerase/dehydratase family protein [Sphaerotilus sp.]|uniref:NAD-dependent epimerase/dehydratase family protein n=1 Tax=Sphaerotilus sp. TaxID=2093942 RepID=UPI0034E19F2F